MSTTTSGITYDLRLNVPALDGDLSQAEARVTASVSRMNALRVVIPVSLDLSAFNAQAAQVNSQMQQWGGAQLGGPGGVGGGGGGNSFSQTQNNVNLAAVQNNLTAIQQSNQSIVNTYTQINQDFSTVNNAAASAAANAQQTATNLRALHRGIYAIAAVAQTIELGADLVDVFSANSPEKNARGIAQTRQDIRSIPIVGGLADTLGHHIGNFAQAIGNSLWAPITGERARGFESDEGYAERIGEEETIREVQLKRMQRDADRTLKGGRALEAFADRANRAARPAESVADRHANEVTDLRHGLSEFEKNLNEQYGGRPLSPGDRQRLEEARAAAAAQESRINVEYKRGQENFALTQDAQTNALRLGNSGQTAAARKVAFEEKLRQEGVQAKAESPEALQRFHRDIEPQRIKQFGKDELLRDEREKEESARRVSDSVEHIQELSLRQSGDAYAADVLAFNHSWDQKLAKMQEAVNQERDLNEKRRRQDELNVAQRERTAEEIIFLEQRQREETAKTVQHEERMITMRLKAGESAETLRLQAAGYTEAAARSAIPGKAERNALEESFNNRINRLSPTDPERKRIEEERDQALSGFDANRAGRLKAFDADRARQADAMRQSNLETDLRRRGQGGMAELLGIRAQAEKDLREAAGDPALQRQIQERERLQVLELGHRAGGGRGEAISPNRVDPLNRLGEKGEDQSRLQQAMLQVLREIEKKIGPAVTT